MTSFSYPKWHASKRRGFTLTEIAIVLGIIGTILGGIWAAASTVHQNSKMVQAQKDLMTIVQNVRSLYASSRQFQATGLQYLTPNLVAANLAPTDMYVITPANDLRDVFGSTVDVTTQAGLVGAPADPNRFEIFFWGMPGTVCLPFIQMATNSAATNNGLVFVYADNVGSSSSISTIDETTFAKCGLTSAPNVMLQYTLK